MIAKSTVIKDRGGKSGGRAVKAVGLTSGGLRCVLDCKTKIVVRRSDRSAEVSRGHSVRWAAHESWGLKSPQRSNEERCIRRRG
jgi:hypothetical protein